MGYVIVGGICLVVGACIGLVTLALVSINRNTEIIEAKEAKDADR